MEIDKTQQRSGSKIRPPIAMLTAPGSITAILKEAGKAKIQRETKELKDSRMAGKKHTK